MQARAIVCAAALLGNGCFAVADIDRFERRIDFDAHLSGFEAFAGQRVEVRLVNQSNVADLVVEARAVIDPMDLDGDHHFVMPLAMAEGVTYGADTFVDLNDNGEWEGGEPLWRSSLEEGGKLHLTATDERETFMDPPTRAAGTAFEMALRGMSVHVDDTQYFELLLFDVSEGRPVGYYFRPDIDEQDFDVRIPQVIVSGSGYEVDYYADANQTNCYETPALDSDHTWRETGTGSSGDPGLSIEFIHHAMFIDVEESFPDVRNCAP